MADQFQIPQRNPQYVAPVMPTDLINEYLNRQQRTAQFGQNNMNNLVNMIAEQQNKRKALEIEAFGQGGPYLQNQMFPTASSTPPGQVAGQVPPPPQPPVTAGQTQPGMVAGQTPQGFQDPQPSEAILNHAAATGYDPTGHAAQYGQMKKQALSNFGISSPGQAAGMGQAGARFLTGYKTLGELALQPGQQQLQDLGIQKTQKELGMMPTELEKKKIDLSNAEKAVPIEIGSKSAEQQNKYQVPETKIQAASMKLQDLWDAFQKVPSSQKGPMKGLITSKLGSPAGGVAPDLVTYNKLREAAAVSMAIARNPENVRPSPQDIADELKNLPSVGDDPQVAKNLFSSTLHDLQHIHDINTQSSQVAAQSFGGNITPGQRPQLNMGGGNIHSQAMQWAQQNQNDPRAKAIMQKAQSALGNGNGL